MRAFRNYSQMAAYDPGTTMPDGRAEPYENYAHERWGAAWKSYYEIKIEYFNSMMANLIMDTLGESLWVDELASSPTNEQQFTVSAPPRIREIATDMNKAGPRVAGGGRGGMAMVRLTQLPLPADPFQRTDASLLTRLTELRKRWRWRRCRWRRFGERKHRPCRPAWQSCKVVLQVHCGDHCGAPPPPAPFVATVNLSTLTLV